MLLESYYKKFTESDDYSELILLMSKILLSGVYMWPKLPYKYIKTMFLCLCLGSLMFVTYGVILFIAKNLKDLNQITFAISLLSNLYQGTTKITMVYYFSDNIVMLLKILNDNFWSATIDKKLFDHLKKRYLIVFRCMLIFLAIVGVFLFGNLIVAIIATIQGKDSPYKVEYPFEWTSSPLFEIIFVIQSITYVYIVPAIALGFDLLYSGICYTIMIQYIVLGYVLEHFGTSRMKEFVEKIDGEEVKDGSNLERIYLKMCVNQHYLLLRTAKMVENTFHIPNFLELCSTIAALCISSFIMIMADIGTDQLIVMLSYMNGYFSQLAIYCAIGNELSYQASLLPDYIYNSKWYDIDDIKIKRDIAILIDGSQIPVKITALKFFHMNLATFVKVLRFTFSLYTLLSTVTVAN